MTTTIVVVVVLVSFFGSAQCGSLATTSKVSNYDLETIRPLKVTQQAGRAMNDVWVEGLLINRSNDDAILPFEDCCTVYYMMVCLHRQFSAELAASSLSRLDCLAR